MKYKFCSFRINVTKYDVTFATKGVLNPLTVATLLTQVAVLPLRYNLDMDHRKHFVVIRRV